MKFLSKFRYLRRRELSKKKRKEKLNCVRSQFSHKDDHKLSKRTILHCLSIMMNSVSETLIQLITMSMTRSRSTS
jgi:hypothetical protein